MGHDDDMLRVGGPPSLPTYLDAVVAVVGDVEVPLVDGQAEGLE